MIVSPASFFALFDVLRGLYVQEQALKESADSTLALKLPPKVGIIDEAKRNRILLLLLADLFSMKPVLSSEKTRFKAIGELRHMYPEIFELFISKHITKLKDPTQDRTL